jgi:hypothetical protein
MVRSKRGKSSKILEWFTRIWRLLFDFGAASLRAVGVWKIACGDFVRPLGITPAVERWAVRRVALSEAGGFPGCASFGRRPGINRLEVIVWAVPSQPVSFIQTT